MSVVKNFFKSHTDFLLSATNERQFPKEELPEFSFIGRSNVGKSSLINSIFEKKIALTSNTPGKTRQINFFNHHNKFLITDLPGYGFAKLSKKEAYNISLFVSNYLENRLNLKLLFVLIDHSIGPKKTDLEFLKFVKELNLEIIIVLTKKDKKLKENWSLENSIISKFEYFNASIKDKDSIFELQKRIYNFL